MARLLSTPATVILASTSLSASWTRSARAESARDRCAPIRPEIRELQPAPLHAHRSLGVSQRCATNSSALARTFWPRCSTSCWRHPSS